MMLNIQRVTEHVNQRLPGSTLELIGTRTGENYYRDTEGNYWRVYRFRKALHSLDVAQTPAQIYEGAKAFGRFLFHLGFGIQCGFCRWGCIFLQNRRLRRAT